MRIRNLLLFQNSGEFSHRPDSGHRLRGIDPHRIGWILLHQGSAAADDEIDPVMGIRMVIQDQTRLHGPLQELERIDEVAPLPTGFRFRAAVSFQHVPVVKHHFRRENEGDCEHAAVRIPEVLKRKLEEHRRIRKQLVEIRREIEEFIPMLLHVQRRLQFEHPLVKFPAEPYVRKPFRQKFPEPGNPEQFRIRFEDDKMVRQQTVPPPFAHHGALPVDRTQNSGIRQNVDRMLNDRERGADLLCQLPRCRNRRSLPIFPGFNPVENIIADL